MLNYIGPNDGEGIIIYYNNRQVASDITKSGQSYDIGDNRVVVGRHYTDEDLDYVSVQVDELIFFNEALSDTDVETLFELGEGD